jgi:hypothetical protein
MLTWAFPFSETINYRSSENSWILKSIIVTGEYQKISIKLISISGWWLIYPSEIYENQLGLFFPTEWKNQINVPNHQPDIIVLKQKTII